MALQQDALFSEAKSLYERALSEFAENPDALNMLAMVEYNLGSLDRAATLVAQAARLAPNVPAVRINRRIIDGATRVRTYRPFIFDPLVDRHPTARDPKPLVHIFKVAGNPAGGSEWRGVELARRLRDYATVVLWTENPSLPEIFTRENEIRKVDQLRGDVPRGGTLVIEGSYHRVGRWYGTARYRRVVLLCNVVDPLGTASVLQQLCLPDKPKVELLFASEELRKSAQLPGLFEPSPIDTDLFSPRPQTRNGFVVGRLSRDDPLKHHAAAPQFYRKLASEGMRVRLMGAASIAPHLQDVDGVEIVPESALPAVDFLCGLDCFTYRTNPALTEAWGRVVTEAMSTGLPVVVHANGGYAQLIRHGENGFLFHRDDEALQHIRDLAASPRLRESMGKSARQTILALLSEPEFRRYLDFYLQ